jgi:hypothetical protein
VQICLDLSVEFAELALDLRVCRLNFGSDFKVAVSLLLALCEGW